MNSHAFIARSGFTLLLFEIAGNNVRPASERNIPIRGLKMRIPFNTKLNCISLAAAIVLAGCGGGDGGSSAGSRAGAATSPSASPAAPAPAPAAPVAATPGIDKTVAPVEMPDTVMPVNYKLWFRPNPALNAFDGRADVEIKVLKPVNSIVVAAHRLTFVNGNLTLQPGNIPLIANPQDDGDYYQLRPQSGQIAPGPIRCTWNGKASSTLRPTTTRQRKRAVAAATTTTRAAPPRKACSVSI